MKLKAPLVIALVIVSLQPIRCARRRSWQTRPSLRRARHRGDSRPPSGSASAWTHCAPPPGSRDDPTVVKYGGHQWRHWRIRNSRVLSTIGTGPSFKSVTCIAEDSYGDQYPVTENNVCGIRLGQHDHGRG